MMARAAAELAAVDLPAVDLAAVDLAAAGLAAPPGVRPAGKRGPRRRLISAVLALTLGTAALPGVAAPATAAPAGPLNWQPCPEEYALDPATDQCATLAVPQDYSRPDGPTISLLITRHSPLNRAARQGVIFTNPGGPGGDAISTNALFAELLPDAVSDYWEVVGVQPRGLAHTDALECKLTDEELAAIATFAWAGQAARQACDRTKPDSSRHITTENTARDWDEVRKALGVNTIDIYGLSYGTILGAHYANLFPQHTGKVVLDSAAHRDELWTDLMWQQNDGYKRRFYRAMQWIADNDAHYHLGDTPLKVYQRWSDRVVEEAGGNPTLAPPPAQVGDVPPALTAVAEAYRAGTTLTGPARVRFEAFVRALANPLQVQTASLTYVITRQLLPQRNNWPTIAQLIRDGSQAVLGDQPAAALDSDSPAVATQVMQDVMICNEGGAPARPELLPGWLWHSFVQPDLFELVGYAFASGAMCVGAPPVVTLPHYGNRGLQFQPLVLQGREDPQTPYPGGVRMAKDLGAHLITVGGGDHGTLLTGDNEPLRQAVAEYYTTGVAAVTEVPEGPIIAPLG